MNEMVAPPAEKTASTEQSPVVFLQGVERHYRQGEDTLNILKGADLDVALGDDSIERRQGLRIAQRIAGELDLRLGRFDCALRHFEARFGIVVGVLRNEVLLEQRLVGRPGLGRHRGLGLRRFERSVSFDELRLEVGRVDPRQELAGLDRFPLADGHLAHIARYLGLDRRLPQRLQRTGDREPPRQRLGVDLGEVGGRELENDDLRRFAVGLVAELLEHARGDRAADGADDHQRHRRAQQAPSRPPLCHADSPCSHRPMGQLPRIGLAPGYPVHPSCRMFPVWMRGNPVSDSRRCVV